MSVLEMTLSDEGYLTRTALSASEALSVVRTDRPDLILLDIMLDDISGLKLTGKLKNDPETADIPIILITAKDTETDMVIGLKMGADDYITKPFNMDVLKARMEAVLRRAYPEADQINEVLSAGGIKLVNSTGQVISGSKTVHLTSSEYEILKNLIEAGGDILSRRELLENLGDEAEGKKERIIDVHIATMRKKLGENGKLIRTVHGKGYKILFD